LLAKAQDYTGLREKSALVREALEALIERESGMSARATKRNRVGAHDISGPEGRPAVPSTW
jgi:hypothetical protein